MTPVSGTIGAVLFDEVRQRLLADNRLENRPDDTRGLFQGGLRYFEYESGLTMYLLEIAQ